MAYKITIWKADGKLHETIRLKSIDEIPAIVAYWSTVPLCDRICRSRSGKDERLHPLWLRSNHKSKIVYE